VLDTEAGSVGTTEHTEHTEAGNVGTTEHTEYTEARDDRWQVVFRGRVEGEWYLLKPSKITGKTSKSSVPVLSAQKPWFPQGFSHIGLIALAFCANPCMSMPAGAAPVEIVVSCAALDPKNNSVSRLVSRQSRHRPLRGSRPGMVQESYRLRKVSENLSLHDDTRPLELW
jgi:hypothetical protein